MHLEVRVIGKSPDEINHVLLSLNNMGIPHSHEIIPDIEETSPVCYVGEDSYGADKIEEIKRAYHKLILTRG